MTTIHATAICALALLLGGCLSPSQTTFASATPPAGVAVASAAPPVAVASADDMLPVTEPGQRLQSARRSGGAGGVDPFAELKASEQARVAWEPLRPADLTKPSILAARTASMNAAGQFRDPASTASLMPAAKSELRGGGAATANDSLATLNRLESDARRINKPICNGC